VHGVDMEILSIFTSPCTSFSLTCLAIGEKSGRSQRGYVVCFWCILVAYQLRIFFQLRLAIFHTLCDLLFQGRMVWDCAKDCIDKIVTFAVVVYQRQLVILCLPSSLAGFVSFPLFKLLDSIQSSRASSCRTRYCFANPSN